MAKRPVASYARRGPTREPYDTVLIVCEGEKTEPNYFRKLRLSYRLSSANIEVTPAPGTDPKTIVAFAEKRLADYDKVFCVYDGDSDPSAFRQATQKIVTSAAGAAGRWQAVTSTPCFEVWILLHFRYASAPFVGAGRISAGDRVVQEVRTHLPQYAKGDPTTYDQIESRMDAALVNGNRLEAHNTKTASGNPATRVHRLVDYLRKLKPD